MQEAMDCSNSPSSPDTDITDYDSDVTEVQCWDLVGPANLREADGSYLAALELAVHSLQKPKPDDPGDGTPLQAGPQVICQTVPQEAVLATLDAVQVQNDEEATPAQDAASHPFQAHDHEATPVQDTTSHPLRDEEVAPAQGTARHPFPGDPVHHFVDVMCIPPDRTPFRTIPSCAHIELQVLTRLQVHGSGKWFKKHSGRISIPMSIGGPHRTTFRALIGPDNGHVPWSRAPGSPPCNETSRGTHGWARSKGPLMHLKLSCASRP